MCTPRRNIYRRLALAVGVAALLAGPAAAALAPPGLRKTAPSSASGQRLNVPPTPVALVVQAPIKPVDYALPTMDGPGLPAENPNGVPEPASLLTGLLGGLALTAWARRRKGVASEAGEAEPA
jgi:hypothetical protein